jgi:hypothetical protein
MPGEGLYEVKVCYASDVAHAGQRFEVAASADLNVSGITKATHKNWSDFRPFTLGELQFPAAGPYTISVRPLEPVEEELFKLLWVHLSPAPSQGEDR